MEGETIISWNPANWITIVLMVALGYAIIGFVTRLVQSRRSASA